MTQLHKKIGLIACSLMLLSLQPAYATPTTPPTNGKCATEKSNYNALVKETADKLEELNLEKANNATLKYQFKIMVENFNKASSLDISVAITPVALQKFANIYGNKLAPQLRNMLLGILDTSGKIETSNKVVVKLQGDFSVLVNRRDYAKRLLDVCLAK